MPEPIKCKHCGADIWFATSKRTGKKYPINSENDPRDLHQCLPASPTPSATPSQPSPPTRAHTTAPTDLSSRVSYLESVMREVQVRLDRLEMENEPNPC